MVVKNLKAETLSMMDKRKDLDDEMNVILLRLAQAGVGLHGNLVDDEGFPRSDIDVHAVRADRHRLHELQSDFKQLTEMIDENVKVVHSGRLQSSSFPVNGSGTNMGESDNENSFAISSSSSNDTQTAMDQTQS